VELFAYNSNKLTEVALTKTKMLLKHYVFRSIFTSINPVWLSLVISQTRTWKQLWECLEKMDEQLEELGAADESLQ
jgi:hypothetical protein